MTEYIPLPKVVELRELIVGGFSLFASANIDANIKIGITHIKDIRFQDGLIRTSLGGFINHSETPTCELIKDLDFLVLKSLRKIVSGEEINININQKL